MKKRLLTAVLAIGVILTLAGCGLQADTPTTTEYGIEETVFEEDAVVHL